MTQKEQVLQYLMLGNKLTPLEAFKKFGSLRLSAIIFDLKEEKHQIKTELIAVGKKHVAQYSMESVIDNKGQSSFML